MSDGGQIIPVNVMTSLNGVIARPNIYRSLFPPPPPLTRRQRIKGRLYGVRWYLRHLGFALLNRCDRETER
jgi:hypothetical protein